MEPPKWRLHLPLRQGGDHKESIWRQSIRLDSVRGTYIPPYGLHKEDFGGGGEFTESVGGRILELLWRAGGGSRSLYGAIMELLRIFYGAFMELL